jgi:ATP-binding cassette subfamily B protein RaxB
MSMTQLNFNWRAPRRKLPVFLQDQMAECGHACVAMISCYFGHQVDLNAIRQIKSSSSLGVTLVDIMMLFERMGFMTRPLKVDLSDIQHIQCPAVIHWNLNHFVVLKEVLGDQVVIHDPAMGVVQYTLNAFSDSFTGIVLEVDPLSSFKPIIQQSTLRLRDLFQSIRGLRHFGFYLLLLSLCIEVLALTNPLFMQYVTDYVLVTSDRGNLYVIAMVFIVLLMIQIFTALIRGKMVIYLSNHLTAQFSSFIANHLLRLPLDYFEKRHQGDIQSRFQSIDEIQKKIGMDFINTVLDGIMVILNFIVMLFYSRLLTLIVSVSLGLYLLLRYAMYRFLKQATERSISLHAKSSSLFLETLKAIVPIKSFSKEHNRVQLWRNTYFDSLNSDIKIGQINLIYEMGNQFLFHLDHIIVVCVGASLVIPHQFSLGMLMAFLAYRLQLVNKASSLIQHLSDYQLVKILLSRLNDILSTEEEKVLVGIGDKATFRGLLHLKDLSFRYHSDAPFIFHHFNLTVQPGEKVAIIGPSGCGKTTLLKVMMGLLKATEGDMMIDADCLDDFGLKNYREVTASVMQDDVLLSGSILDNITFFEEGVDMTRVLSVTGIANIHNDIMTFPMGYQTLVGDMGSTLSGGQKQRLLLARALYKQPKILFLDEATSHLDVANEQSINSALKALSITQIIVAHRRETIEMADRVIDLRQMMNISNHA